MAKEKEEKEEPERHATVAEWLQACELEAQIRSGSRAPTEVADKGARRKAQKLAAREAEDKAASQAEQGGRRRRG